MERRLAAILAADLVGYSRLIRADEEGTLAALAAVRTRLIEPLVAEHRGRIVKLMGDGLLAEFGSVVDAVRCAAKLQTAMAESSSAQTDSGQLVLRIGINLGDIVIDGDDIQGDGVNLAARLEGLASPGGVCISEAVYEQIRDRLEIEFEAKGRQTLKNIDRPIAVWQWTPNPGANRLIERNPVFQRPSIGVLRFDNLSDDTRLDHFCAGLSESLITDLSRSNRLAVASRAATFAYAGKTSDPIALAHALGVQFLITGSAQATGQRLRANVQLIDGRTGDHLWANRYDYHADDLFDAQDNIVEQVIVEVDAALDVGEMARKRREIVGSAKAYAIYQKAYGLSVGGTRDSVLRARHEWNNLRDIARSPALALGGLASCDLMEIRYGWTSNVDESVAHCLKLVAEALELLPDFSFFYALRSAALLFDGRADEALQAGRQAFDLDPTYGNSLGQYAVALAANNDLQAAQRIFQNYLEITPVPQPHYRCQYALLQYLQGHSDLALAELGQYRGYDKSGLTDMYYGAMARDQGSVEDAEHAIRDGLKKNAYLTTAVFARNLKAYRNRKACEQVLVLLQQSGLPAE